MNIEHAHTIFRPIKSIARLMRMLDLFLDDFPRVMTIQRIQHHFLQRHVDR